MSFKRMAWANVLRPEKIAVYKELHVAAWPGVLEQISKSNIKNYSIYLREPENLLFGYFEYHGENYDADMARMAEDPLTRKWWALTDPCQNPLDSAKDGENWVPMVEVFHHD